MAAVLAPGDWDELIAAFREHKLISGEIKPSTWHRVYRHHMNHLLGSVAVAAPPQNAKQLLETLARIWADKPGGRTRQIQIQSTAALLRWAVAERRLGEDLEPPQELAVFVGRSRAAKAITTPLEVEPILALVQALPDARWRFALQLMAAYGLRPEERQHLQIRQGRLWCMDERVAMYGHPPYNNEAFFWCAMSPVETMLHAAIEAIDEPRSARMDQRTKPSVKASIEAAADLMGIEASAFVVMSAYARAQELLSGKQQTLLSQGDHQALLAALDEETTPTPALLEAWQLHQDQVVRS